MNELIRRIGGLEIEPRNIAWRSILIRRIGGLEIESQLAQINRELIRRIGGLENGQPKVQ